MKANFGLMVAGLGLLLTAAPAMAHHSFAAEYDGNKPVTLKGTVTKIDWMNPHIWVYLDVKDDNGSVTHWQCEGGPPNSLTRNGWTKNALKIGDQVTVEGFRAKDGTNTINSRSVKLPDGRSVFAGSADDGGPNARRAAGAQ
ncbi:MAG TPA: DUF6152 family protein [Bryobacteraceae bacterium]|nr:DUF6152 family protein [Bryobacteraceae bacterium]